MQASFAAHPRQAACELSVFASDKRLVDRLRNNSSNSSQISESRTQSCEYDNEMRIGE